MLRASGHADSLVVRADGLRSFRVTTSAVKRHLPCRCGLQVDLMSLAYAMHHGTDR